jgi:hypothetical protein
MQADAGMISWFNFGSAFHMDVARILMDEPQAAQAMA